MSDLVQMVNHDTGKLADVRKDQVSEWAKSGWRLVAVAEVAKPEPAVIAKGPRGKFYIKQDGKIVSQPFETEEDAQAALSAG